MRLRLANRQGTGFLAPHRDLQRGITALVYDALRAGNPELAEQAHNRGWTTPRGARVKLFSYSRLLAPRRLATERGVWFAQQEQAVPVPVIALDGIAFLGPLDRDINGREQDKSGRPRGPFDVLPLVPGEEPTYPVLWEHDASRETALEFGPDCKAVPRLNADERKLVEVAASKTHLHVSRDWQFNSQPLQAQWTSRPALGGRAWPSICLHPHEEGAPCDPEKERLQSIALLLWLNSTPGILIRWFCSNRQQHGRGAMTRETLAAMPVLDVRRLSEGSCRNARICSDGCATGGSCRSTDCRRTGRARIWTPVFWAACSDGRARGSKITVRWIWCGESWWPNRRFTGTRGGEVKPAARYVSLVVVQEVEILWLKPLK